MKKIYTIHSVTRTAIAPDKGAISWLISDENERERRVSGVTTLNKNAQIIATRAIHAREAPLVAELLLHEEGDTFGIDFTAYNLANAYVEREVYANMQRQARLGAMGDTARWVLAGLAVLAIIWLGWTLYESMTGLTVIKSATSHELP